MVTVADIISANVADFLTYAKAYQEHLIDSYLRDYARDLGLTGAECLHTDGRHNTFYFEDYAILVKGDSTAQILASAIDKVKWLKEPDSGYKVSLYDDQDCVVYRLAFDWKQSNMYKTALWNSTRVCSDCEPNRYDGFCERVKKMMEGACRD